MSADLYVAHIFTFSKWGNCWHPNFFRYHNMRQKCWNPNFLNMIQKCRHANFLNMKYEFSQDILQKMRELGRRILTLPGYYTPGRLTHQDMILWGDWLTKILYDHCGDLAQKVDFIILLGDWPVRTWSRRIRMMKNTGGKNLAGLSL